ncbi:MAG: hypothetical protein KatS3mg078_1151 [Deltaproteobacteria bacterium]|jgi:signal peptidase I|nr:MAG: hypothetical protein KatS3mg078_1151 [Deltaproteobacteria bacterium]
MFGILSREYRVKNRARKEIIRVRTLLAKSSSRIDPDIKELVQDKLEQTRRALDDGNLRALELKVEELKKVADEHLSKFGKSKLRQNVEALLIALVLALFIRTFIVQPFKIPSGSMIPTLLVGDHLLVAKFIYGTRIPYTDIVVLPGIRDMRRGDVIVFTYPNYEHDPSREGVYYIKRLIGLPGDSIDIVGRNLYINGREVPLEFLGDYYDDRTEEVYDLYEEDLFGVKHHVIYRKGKEFTEKGTYIPVDKVPDGYVFVMGDNRDNSQDSRFWGFVPVKNIAGKAFIVHWSWDFGNKGILNKVRWNRILSVIH